MEKGPSGTAIMAAMTRAAHLFMDDEPKIFHDNLALKLSGMQNETTLKSALDEFYSGMARQFGPEYASGFSISYRAFAVMRHRYTEDELEKAVERGVSQYIIMGAGLDSFAYRRRDMEDKVQIFEIDYPATQEWKKTRLQGIHVTLPRNLTFVPVDFEKQTMMSELYTHGYRKEFPAFFCWLGVTQYLTEATVFQTLHDVVTAKPGSEIVFEYMLPESLLGSVERQTLAEARKRPVEPVLSTFTPIELTGRLRQMGFTDVLDFGPEEANRLYFNTRKDDLSSSSLDKLSLSILKTAHLMKARVGT